MSNAQGQNQGQSGFQGFMVPPLPPVRMSAEQASQQVTAGLRYVLNQHQDGRIGADAAKQAMSRYLISYFTSFNICHDPQAVLQAWYGRIDEHERCLTSTAHEGHQRQEFAGTTECQGGQNSGVTGRISIQNLLDGPEPTCQSRPPGMPPNAPIGGVGTQGDVRGSAFNPQAHVPSEGSDSDEDSTSEGRQRKKKSKQDESLFEWAAEAFIQESILSPRHRKVLELADNYSADIDASIKSLERAGNIPVLPKKIWKSVLRDEFIDLGEVLAQVSSLHSVPAIQNIPNNLAEAFEFTTIAKPAPTKAITDQVTWRRAWQSAARAITFAFPF
ncbi:hypothetical protein GYMLUDRAFT_243973 [Collybiopsis luxurians FD-317 M1]|uniref:Uncharacterized protein n=1 Tax=Collybiopsis luxurians FD-317 M1 TaxID=944289 RepID=A0A0D0BAR1_9AGAR|nr:hypothetical protein GYMLUDRAFT_243973 [Collybiopsis luxurians FD-317 M1]